MVVEVATVVVVTATTKAMPTKVVKIQKQSEEIEFFRLFILNMMVPCSPASLCCLSTSLFVVAAAALLGKAVRWRMLLWRQNAFDESGRDFNAK